MWPKIRNHRLTVADVPPPNADFEILSRFALTYYCHTSEGTVANGRVIEIDGGWFAEMLDGVPVAQVV